MTTWTKNHHLAALRGGWILTNDSDDNYYIAKVDDPPAWPEHERGQIKYNEPKFKSDANARAHVKRAAKVGKRHALVALSLVGKPIYPKRKRV